MFLSHSFVTNIARNIGLSAPEGYETQSSMLGNNRCLLLCPLSDVSFLVEVPQQIVANRHKPTGVYFGILNAIFNNTTVILPLPDVPPTGENLARLLRHVEADWAALTPPILETISNDSSLLDETTFHLGFLVFAGGCLAKRYGDVIASKIKLMPSPNAPETGPLPTIYPHEHDFRYDWNYFQLHPALGAKFIPLSGNVYELTFNRTPATDLYLPIFANSYEFLARDLYTKHPAIPDIWTQASQVVSCISGEKPEAFDLDKHVCRFPEILATL
jgi:hypothetical protein